MENKILEAVKALGGDWKSEKSKVAICITRPELNWSHAQFFDECYFAVPALYLSESWASVTQSEFNTYAEQWLKQAYMHNAAIDLDWDVDNSCGHQRNFDIYLCLQGCAWVTYRDINDGSEYNFEVICTIQEFIDYCEANKPEPITALVFTQAMADAGELPPIGSEALFDNRRCEEEAGEVVAIHRDVAMINYGPNRHHYCVVPLKSLKPIQSPRDKAIDEMFAECYPNKKPSELLSIALGKLYDAGYRKDIK